MEFLDASGIPDLTVSLLDPVVVVVPEDNPPVAPVGLETMTETSIVELLGPFLQLVPSPWQGINVLGTMVGWQIPKL